MEVLSPRSTNMPIKSQAEMKKTKEDKKPKPQEKPANPDRIDDKWRPPMTVTEPGSEPETFLTGRKLGKGGFAVCFEGKSQASSKVFALKVVKAKVEQKKMAEKFRTELQIHAKMEHPNIVDFLRAFTYQEHTYVVLELCTNGNLNDMVKGRGCLSLPETRRYMIQICGAVKYMHRRSVIHRDMKMGNIFLDAQMNIKIGDFGLAAVMADEQDRRTTLCGTPNYIAPEILSKSGTRGHDNKVDTWAIGVICYAMLMGTPPFQSKSQQEIYQKLRSLEYEWKIDSKNYIPQQAKDFVASCLNLVSAERPGMDELVEHEFFTMGVVADVLDSSCLRSRPEWLLTADPRGDKVRAGYGISQPKACRLAGVGRGADGKSRQPVGGKTHLSTLMEIEAENRAGCAPTIPLPEGFLYNAFSEAQAEWTLKQKHPLLPAKPRSRKPMSVREAPGLEKIVEDQLSEAAPKQTMRAPTLPTAKTGIPSFAAQQRQQALPQRTLQRQVTNATSEQIDGVSKTTTAPNGCGLRARPVRAASVRVTRSAASSNPEIGLSRTMPKSTSVPSMFGNEAVNQTRPESRSEIRPVDTERVSRLPASQTVRSSSRRLLTEDNATTRPTATLPRRAEDIAARALQPTTGNDRQAVALRDGEEEKMTTKESNTSPTTSSAPAHRPKSRIIAQSDGYTTLHGTSATDIVENLRDIHAALSSRRSGDYSATSTTTTTRRLRARLPYPRVDKWVDYSGKHGISYLLADGTLGMVMRSSEDNSRPSSCVVVRNARAHTINRAKGLEYQFVPQSRRGQAVEFYEQSDTSKDIRRLEVPSRKFALDIDNHATPVEAASAAQASLSGSELERFKEVALLDKFGKYMNKGHEGTEAEVEQDEQTPSNEHLVHFYQRVGNVGVWRFSDGGLQFNFPDHTKLLLYHDRTSRTPELLVDVLHLDLNDARDLARRGRLTTNSLDRRTLITLSLADLMSDVVSPSEGDVVRANEVKEKVSWIRAVIGCWVKEGGIGRMGEEKLGWSGLQERRDDRKTKLQWVTVGRLGGDGDFSSNRG